MAAYMVFEVNVTNDSWQAQYRKPTAELVEKHGGRYLAVGAAEKVEGERPAPNAVVVIEFPSVEAAKAWHADPDYQPLLKLRRSGSTAEALLVPGM